MLKVYIENYRAKTEFGCWVELPHSDEGLEVIKSELGIEILDDYIITDYEDTHGHQISEYDSLEYCNRLAEIQENYSDELLDAFNEYHGTITDLDEYEALLNDAHLYEDIQDDYDLGYYWIEESGCYDLSSLGDVLSRYFDYEAFGRDIRLEASGCHTSWGWFEQQY